jgi:glyoxylase-like metal-dependent hydrolase (beta-lactamase superfamily II)
MQFLTEPAPRRDLVMPVLAGVSRIVAANPGPMTYHGTNTYLIEQADGITVLDPGPDDAVHVRAIVAATAGRVARILVSHSHADHFGAVAALRAATGAPVCAYRTPQDGAVVPDIGLVDGDAVGALTVVHTPGHAADHLCFARADGVLFTADHVMGWSTTVVSPPHGDMVAYFASLHRLLAREDRVYLPAHGPLIDTPAAYVRSLLDHRSQRETAILAALGHGSADPAGLVVTVYGDIPLNLRRAAERNVVSHLQKLLAEGRVRTDGAVWDIA